ncbi:MAG: hypothetical protein C4527_12335 [Candidatus Omnitrophota bacterium]|jgi:outer membrane protein assembly factor BamB|nr:MAG: hypothetical protein C4527_12335 [Candidatus Omnitrophota bacterium]
MKQQIHRFSLFLIFTIAANGTGYGEDWPMWRYDARRSAASPQALPQELHLLWEREYPPLEPTWENPLNRDLMQFDKAYEPIVMGKTMFIGSNAFDQITALDTDSGEERWTFYADGPIRFPAVANDGKVYFVSDDGHLYCVDAENGALIWKFSGIPSDRKILGNERLISTWPARGGPVFQDGIIYFAAGIWPFMGIFIYALDAETGEEIWCNDHSSSIYMKQPHNSPSFASIAPQGILVVAGDKLLVPGGRSTPACLDLKTGEFLYYKFAEHNKTGGAFVCATDRHFINYHRDQVTSLYDLESGNVLKAQFGRIPVLSGTVFYSLGNPVIAHDYTSLRSIRRERVVKDSTTNETKTEIRIEWKIDPLWEIETDAGGDMIQAGNRLYAGGDNIVSAIDIPRSGNQPSVSWQTKIPGTVARLIAADDKLFIVTLEGRIYAFGGKPAPFKTHPLRTHTQAIPDAAAQQAHDILQYTNSKEGYCLAYGLENGDVVEALVRWSDLRIIAVDSDRKKVNRLRKRFIDAGLYGKRISVHVGDPLTFPAPSYLTHLTIFENFNKIQSHSDSGFFQTIYNHTRPYGGIICMKPAPDKVAAVAAAIRKCDLPNAKIIEADGLLLLIREGALPGASDWTHQYGDIANTVKSDDQLVKLPLGILWFGGNSNTDVLPRHGHGPPEQIVDGRLFIQGINSLSARDVYTGRVLWKRMLPDLDTYGVYYDETYADTPLDPAYNQIHIPGANARGTNYVVAKDKIYIVIKNSCLVLDPAAGEIIGEITLPIVPGEEQPPDWGYIGVYQEYLIAGAEFVNYIDFIELDSDIASKRKPFYNFDITSSKRLVVMDRHTGEVRWTYTSAHGLRHNAIAVGNDNIFCIDRTPDFVSDRLKRRGKRTTGVPRLLAFDVTTGDISWSSTEDVFGTWLGYSEENDILLQAVRHSRDMLVDEPDEGMAAYRGKTGERLWQNDAEYRGPCILHGDRIITEPYAYSLLTGKEIIRTNPLTGEQSLWSYQRNYGCNYPIACENLLTFRSAAAGFFDLQQDGGTGNFGGFKSGCTSNLIGANGVLNAPDYTRTCSCSYQNQSSLAMIHDPDVEMWTFNNFDVGDGVIRQAGINLGAPGDRRAENGTLWMEYPSKGSPSPEIPILTEPAAPHWFHHHSSRFDGAGLKWVAASGAKGLRKITLQLATDPQPAQTYAVGLLFAEPDPLQPGDRVFDVSIQGRKVLRDFDIRREAGATHRGIVKEFHRISISRDLEIALDPRDKRSPYAPILCGIEIISETVLTRNAR